MIIELVEFITGRFIESIKKLKKNIEIRSLKLAKQQVISFSIPLILRKTEIQKTFPHYR